MHLVERLADIFEAGDKGWSHLDETPSQILPCSIVHVESNVPFPEREDFSDDVVFEELHAREHIEHRGLLHPFAQGEELSRYKIELLASSAFFLADVDHTLRGNGEILTFERLFSFFIIWIDLNQVVRTKLVTRYWFPLAVDKFDWSVMTVFGEEGNSLLSGFNL